MKRPHIPELPYSEFSQRLHDKTVGRHIPVSGSIEVTLRCNLGCVHCYVNLPADDRLAQEHELSANELYSILDQIVDEGCLWLLLTGGEPLIRPDFLNIYTYAKKKGLLVTLFTNGTAITPHIADQLAEWRPFAIEITFYGRTQETYERVTGAPGSYARCMRGIELLLERNLPLKLKTMVLTLNLHELWEMKTYAEELGVEFRYDPVLNVRADGSRTPAAVRIPLQEVVALDLADAKRLQSWHEFCERSWPSPNPQDLYHCGAGLSAFHIDAYGQLSLCMMARLPAYDLRKGTFHEGWHKFLLQARTQKRKQTTPCQYCDLFWLCGQCPGWAQIENGNPEEPVVYLCQIAHLRAEAFGLNRSCE